MSLNVCCLYEYLPVWHSINERVERMGWTPFAMLVQSHPLFSTIDESALLIKMEKIKFQVSKM